MTGDNESKSVKNGFGKCLIFAFKFFLQYCLVSLMLGLFVFIFSWLLNNPVKDFVSIFNWYVSSDSISAMTVSEKKMLAHLMSENYILSTNDLLSQIGSFYSYTITILIFFCTFSAFFAVLVIKMNADDKFDYTISSKVKYFFANDKGFDTELKNKVSDVFTEEFERLSDENIDGNDEVIRLRNEVDVLKKELTRIKDKLLPIDEPFDEKLYFRNMLDSMKGNAQPENRNNEDNTNGNP
ncbi:hypothetical protein [Citrobacter amalonaticus]|uniref:hypothetical protein n=1 Tax=Citrobacter amalonaticus TaxID=35703 RepID=UPI001A1F7BE7|nr:hypothetical protein [Citrobacter amalonaticus]HDQ2811415.1 hypothetical protein [Citrobacter amalonaticus]